MSIEKVILSNLVENEEYSRKVIPFLKSEYFQSVSQRIVYNIIDEYVKKYNAFPSKEALNINLENQNGINEQTFKESKELIEELRSDKNDLQWLLDQTEKYCQEKAVYNAIMSSIQILDDKTGKVNKGSIPQILSDALAISFDSHVGHDFLEDTDSRFEYYHRKENRIPFDLSYLNAITNGGIPNKTLNIALAGCVHPNTKVRIRFRKNTVF